MKCAIIVSPDEVVEGALEFHQMGYELELWPSTQDLSALTDERDEEWTPFLGRPPATAERSHVRSLRASFIQMLCHFSEEKEDLIIFGESDACPVMEANRIKTALQRELAQHPETDVFRLFHDAQWSRPTDIPKKDPIMFDDFQTGSKDANIPYVWGTHALVIPSKSRAKVARIFADYRLPVDIALEAANTRGELKIRHTTINPFYQKKRTGGNGRKRIAACLSSYKRLPDLQRQILAMMDQDYQDIHLFVAVKGIPESTFRKVLLPQFEHFIREGRLTMRLFPNKNQLSNFLDTVRELDISAYDLFAKVDDDDIYDRDYFSMVDEFHRFLPPGFSSYYYGSGFYLDDRSSFPFVEQGRFLCFGPTMVFSQTVLNKLRTCEEAPDRIADISPLAGRGGYGFTEDRLMNAIMHESGSSNRFLYVKNKGNAGNLTICRNNASVMRGGLVPADFRKRNEAISGSEQNYEHIIEVKHPAWRDLLRIMNGRAYRSQGNDRADVLHFSASELLLKWDNWGTEQYKRGEKGVFSLVS